MSKIQRPWDFEDLQFRAAKYFPYWPRASPAFTLQASVSGRRRAAFSDGGKVLLSYVGVSDDGVAYDTEQGDFIFFGEERTTDMTDWVDDC